jgi:HEPN domain-containing protein
MKPGREAALHWLRQAEHDLAIARGHQERGDYSDALAPPAVPFESYTQEQGTTAVAAAQSIIALVAENLHPATEP